MHAVPSTDNSSSYNGALTVFRCRRKAEKVNIEYRSLHFDAKKPASHKLKDDRDSSPGGIVEENPVIIIGLQSISENGLSIVCIHYVFQSTVSVCHETDPYMYVQFVHFPSVAYIWENIEHVVYIQFV